MDDQIRGAFDNLLTRLRRTCPELVEILDAAKSGRLSEAEAMQQLLAQVSHDPSLARRFQEQAREATAVLRPPQPNRDVLPLPTGVIDTGVGLPRLNPLFEAALIERSQFDGDIPEFRTGPLPKGVAPAVPVQTAARNPILIGKLLQDASVAVAEDITVHEAKRLKGAEETFQIPDGALEVMKHAAEKLVPVDQDASLVVWGSAETDHPTYRRGQVPAPITVPVPSGSALARMTPEEEREHAWRFLSTTQGRQSALGTLQDGIKTLLEQKGFQVKLETEHLKIDRILVKHQWVVQMAGAGGTQPAFSFLDTAIRALATVLANGCTPRAVLLYVYPVNTVSDREVGWGACLVAKAPVGELV